MSVYGQVELVEIEKNPSTGGSLGIAIVGFGGEDGHTAANLAIEKGHRRKMGQSNNVKIEFDPNGEKLKIAIAEILRHDTTSNLDEPPRRPAASTHNSNVGLADEPPTRPHHPTLYREEGEVIDEELGKWSSGYDNGSNNNNNNNNNNYRYRHSRDYMDRRYYDDSRYRGYSNRSPPPYDYHHHPPPPPRHSSSSASSSSKYYSRYPSYPSSSRQYDMDRYESSSRSSYGHLPPPQQQQQLPPPPPPPSSSSSSSHPPIPPSSSLPPNQPLQIKTSASSSSLSSSKWDQPPSSASSSIYESKYKSRSRSRSHTRSHSQSSRSRSRSRSIGRDPPPSNYYGNNEYSSSSRSRWDYDNGGGSSRDNWDYHRRKRNDHWYARDDYRRPREDYRPVSEKLPTILIPKKHLPFMRGVLEELRKSFYHYNYLDIYHDSNDWHIVFDSLSDAKRAMAMDRRYLFGYVLYLGLQDGSAPADDDVSQPISSHQEEQSSVIDTGSIKTTEPLSSLSTEIDTTTTSEVLKYENEEIKKNISPSLPPSSSVSSSLIIESSSKVDNNNNSIDQQNNTNNNKNVTTLSENSQVLESNNNENSTIHGITHTTSTLENKNDSYKVTTKALSPSSSSETSTAAKAPSHSSSSPSTTNPLLSSKDDDIVKHAKQILFSQLADVFLKDVKNRVIGPCIYDFLNPALHKKKAVVKNQSQSSEDNKDQMSNVKESINPTIPNGHSISSSTQSDIKKNKENDYKHPISSSFVDTTKKSDSNKPTSMGLYDSNNNTTINKNNSGNNNNTDMLYSLPKSAQSILESSLPSFNKLPRFKKRNTSTTTASSTKSITTSSEQKSFDSAIEKKPFYAKRRFTSKIHYDDSDDDDEEEEEEEGEREEDYNPISTSKEKGDNDKIKQNGLYNDDFTSTTTTIFKHSSIDTLKKNRLDSESLSPITSSRTTTTSISSEKLKLDGENVANHNNTPPPPQEDTFFSSSEEGEYQSGASVHLSDNEINGDFEKLAHREPPLLSASSTTKPLSSSSSISTLKTTTTTTTTKHALAASLSSTTPTTTSTHPHSHKRSSNLERKKPRRLRDYLSDDDEEEEFDHRHAAFLRQLHQDDENNDSTDGGNSSSISFTKKKKLKKKRLFSKKDSFNDDDTSSTDDDNNNELENDYSDRFYKKKKQQQQQGKGKKLRLDTTDDDITTTAIANTNNDIFEEISGEEYMDRKKNQHVLSSSKTISGKMKKRKRSSLLQQQQQQNQKYLKLEEGVENEEFMDIDQTFHNKKKGDLSKIKKEQLYDNNNNNNNDSDFLTIKNEKMDDNKVLEAPVMDRETYERMLLEPDSSDDDLTQYKKEEKEDDTGKHLLELHPDWDPFQQAKDVEDFDFLRLAIMEKLGLWKGADADASSSSFSSSSTTTTINNKKHQFSPIPPLITTEKENGGCARSRGYYVIPDAEKATYLPKNKAVLDTSTLTTRLSSRTNRVNNRRFVVGMVMQKKAMADSDILKFNQLKGRKKQLRFAKSPIHDWGLYAEEHIDANDMVIEYVGEVIRQQVAEEREKKYERCGIGSSYLFRVDDDIVIDATQKGSIARFINHCCTPNCSAKIITVDKHKKIVIYANRDIEPGEEITYDYKFPIEADKIPCLCGSKFCKGTLN
ncbi:unnamed protein product [Cunninghamella echinulata]